eukprot:477050_1
MSEASQSIDTEHFLFGNLQFNENNECIFNNIHHNNIQQYNILKYNERHKNAAWKIRIAIKHNAPSIKEVLGHPRWKVLTIMFIYQQEFKKRFGTIIFHTLIYFGGKRGK